MRQYSIGKTLVLAKVVVLLLFFGCSKILPNPDLPKLSQVVQTGGPLVVDWTEDARAEMESRTRNSIVLVAFDGREITPIYGCTLNGSYSFQSTSIDERVLRFQDIDEVRVNLPLSGWGQGAVLESQLESGNSIEVALVTVGLMSSGISQISRDKLSGPDCGNVTHFVRALTVGAFAMGRNATEQASSALELFGTKQGAKGEKQIFEYAFSGDRVACVDKNRELDNPPRDCRAPLRLFLEPLEEHINFDELKISARSKKWCEKMGLWQFAGECAIKLHGDVEDPALGEIFVPLSGDIDTKGLAADFLAKCEKGSVAACTNFGLLVIHNLVEVEDDALVNSVLNESCQKGFLDACMNLGIAKANGLNCEPDQEEAKRFFDLACTEGLTRSCTYLGMTNRNDEQLKEDGFALLSQSCDDDDWLACAFLASLYEIAGELPGRHIPTAISLYDRACELGDARSCTEAGYLQIETEKKNPAVVSSAMDHFKKACAGADPWGCWWLATCYLEGFGEPIDLPRAVEFYKKGCSLGNSSACVEYWRTSSMLGH